MPNCVRINEGKGSQLRDEMLPAIRVHARPSDFGQGSRDADLTTVRITRSGHAEASQALVG